MRRTLITVAFLCLMPTLAFAGAHEIKDWSWNKPAYTDAVKSECCCKNMGSDMSNCCCKKMGGDMANCCCKGKDGKQCMLKKDKSGKTKKH